MYQAFAGRLIPTSLRPIIQRLSSAG